VGTTNTIGPVAVSNGLFTVALDFGADFPGADRWLEIGVRTNGTASYTTLSPRQKLTPSPYALTASNLSGTLPASQLSGTLPSALLGGTYSGALTLNNAANSFTGSGAGLTSLDANNLSSGTVAEARLSANVALLNRNPQTFTGQNIFNNGVGIGTTSPAAPLHVKQGSGSGVTPDSAAIVGDAQGKQDGIWGGSGATNGIGVVGRCDNGAFAVGVYGRSASGYGGYGVYGLGNYGVYGVGGLDGVYGSGTTHGVYGDGGTYGVYGSGTDTGVYGSAGNVGVYGSSGVYGVFGYGAGYGVFGYSASGTGVYAQGNPAIQTVGSVGINVVPAATLHVVGTTATALNNTADFYNPSIGPNHSHIHYGTRGDWYIRSATAGGCVIMQDQAALAYVLIGTDSPSAKLTVSGNICASGTIGACSDQRLKEQVCQLNGGLETILKLQGVNFRWRTREFPEHHFGEERQVGFIAQAVKEVLPEIVTEGKDGFYSVDYGRLAPVLVEAIKSQQVQLRAAENANDQMRQELAAQTELTGRLQGEFAALQKAVGRLADKSANTFATHPEAAEAK
jgi:hypothetical protein